MGITALAVLAGYAAAASHHLRKDKASSFLKSKADDEYLAGWSDKEIRQANQIATSFGLTSVKAWVDYLEEMGATQGDKEDQLEVFEDCVSACKWADWRADWRGTAYRMRMLQKQEIPTSV